MIDNNEIKKRIRLFSFILLILMSLVDSLFIQKGEAQTPTPNLDNLTNTEWETLSINSITFFGPGFYSELDNRTSYFIAKEQELAKKIYNASLNYIAETPEISDKIAQKIGFAGGKVESASNASGPLSIAILKDAGLLPGTTDIHDIGLLCAPDRSDCNGIEVLQNEYFPPEEYDYFLIKESVRSYDFISNPLQTGDWLYLFVKNNGFDHMLTVTRIDENGAAYTVTNVNRGNGFIISEELLYDPSKPGTGLFYELTDHARTNPKINLSITGDGGFLLVRRKGGIGTTPVLNSDLDKTLIEGVVWNGLIKNIGSGEILYESLPYQTFHPASMIKIPISLLILEELENQGYTLEDLYTDGVNGRTFHSLLYSMVVNSEEEASYILLSYLKNHNTYRSTLKEWGLLHTSLDPRRTTANDLAIALEGLYVGKFLGSNMQSYLLNLMSTPTENDTMYLGQLTQALTGANYYNKRGTLFNPLILGDMGILTYNNTAYIIVLCGHLEKSKGPNYADIERSMKEFAIVFAESIR